MCGESGLTTEGFVDAVAKVLETGELPEKSAPDSEMKPRRSFRRNYDVDVNKMASLFSSYDIDGNGAIDFEEFTEMAENLGIAPMKMAKEE